MTEDSELEDAESGYSKEVKVGTEKEGGEYPPKKREPVIYYADLYKSIIRLKKIFFP